MYNAYMMLFAISSDSDTEPKGSRYPIFEVSGSKNHMFDGLWNFKYWEAQDKPQRILILSIKTPKEEPLIFP